MFLLSYLHVQVVHEKGEESAESTLRSLHGLRTYKFETVKSKLDKRARVSLSLVHSRGGSCLLPCRVTVLKVHLGQQIFIQHLNSH